VPFYRRLFPLIQAHCPFLLPTQAANLALLIGALLSKRTLCLTTLAGAFPVPPERQVACPKHELLHRLKRLSRFLANEPVDPVAVQVAFVPTVLARLGTPRWLGLVVDWTSFETTLPHLRHCRGRRSYQVLTIGLPRRGRALPLLSVADEQGHFPVPGSQNTAEQDALARVLDALPPGVRAVVIGDRAFGRAELIQWLQTRRAAYVLRLKRGALITEKDGARWKLGEEGTRRGGVRWVAGCRYGTYHDKPRDLWINLACSWRLPKRCRADRRGKEYREPWYLATSLTSLGSAVAWYRQRMWIEETFRDCHATFGLDRVQVAAAPRLGRLVAALNLALAWLHLLALPETAILPRNWAASVVTRGRASLISLALAFLDALHDFPLRALPKSRPKAA
jgi:hypothetical protein